MVGNLRFLCLVWPPIPSVAVVDLVDSDDDENVISEQGTLYLMHISFLLFSLFIIIIEYVK